MTGTAGGSPEPGQFLTRKGQATYDRIVAAAAELIFDQGVASTTFEEVQQRAGVGTSQMYHYFGDKRNLVRAVIAYQTHVILGVHEPYLSKLDSLDALWAWRDFVVDLQKTMQFRGGCPLIGLVSELGERDDAARRQVAEGYARWEAAIRDGMRAMHERGEICPDNDPDSLALALLTAYQGALVLTQARRDTAAMEAVLDVVINSISRQTSVRETANRTARSHQRSSAGPRARR